MPLVPITAPCYGCLPLPRQRGISLLIVMVFVMLSMLLALWASRTALFSEMVVGNDADYQRAFEAAQALLQDAEFDIGSTPKTCPLCPRLQVYGNPAKAPLKFPEIEGDDYQALIHAIKEKGGSKNCYQGICSPRKESEDWSLEAIHQQGLPMAGIGARYGEYTMANHENNPNPLLNWEKSKPNEQVKAWYWVEVLPYVHIGKDVPLELHPERYTPYGTVRVVFRINALAKGLKKNTQVLLQQIYVQHYVKE